jgi:hypothetical protein
MGAYSAPARAQSDPIAATASSPDVYLMTMAPGSVYWERFGHNAIVFDPVPSPAGQIALSEQATAFNYGYFDMTEAGFLSRFIQGRMLYAGVQINALDDLAYYRAQGRTVWLQKLGLSDAAKQRLLKRLQESSSAPNDRYRYDYFRNNCSTKLRDALDHALDGALSAQVAGRSTGQTFRSLGLAHAAGELWLYLGIHAGLGPSTDRPLSYYDEYFIPSKLMQGIADKSISGLPLVQVSQQLGSTHAQDAPQAPDWRYRFFVLGLAIAIGIAALARGQHANSARRSWPAVLCAALMGAFGVLLLFLQFTDHSDAHRNLNLTLFNPLWLLLLPICKRVLPEPWICAGVHAAMLIALLGLLLKTLPWIRQQNIEWVLLLLPIQYALWHWRTRSSAA